MRDHPAAVYGDVPRDLIQLAPDAVQCSPRVPGAKVLSELGEGTMQSIAVHAPPGTLERRAVLAAALSALQPGGTLIALAPNTKGGTRLADELSAFGCAVSESHKRRHRIVTTTRDRDLTGVDEARAAGAPRLLGDLQIWSQPGLFNWDRVDDGSRLLLDHLPPLHGRGADLGCGLGVLARAIRQATPPPAVTLIDIDARALDCGRRNVPGDGVSLVWADVRTARDLPNGLDFVVTNPPFHDGGVEDKALGQAFIAAAARMLRPGGVLWLTANRHLPYETVLQSHFEKIQLVAASGGFKVYCAMTASAAPASQRRDRGSAAKVRR